MGGIIGRDTNNNEEAIPSSSTAIEDITECGDSNTYLRRGTRFRKRKKTSIDLAEENKAKLFKLDTPKYVYQKLFLEGYKSDVTIKTLDHVWHLHRVYLEQCEYFRILFNGNWGDSNKKEYFLDIQDENITFIGIYLLNSNFN